MELYVKICRRCSRANDETVDDCACGESLWGVEAVPAPTSAPPPSATLQVPPPSSAPPPPRAASNEPVTRRMDGVGALTLFHAPTGRPFIIHSGDVIGMAHATSQAQVQISGITDYDLIHRQHCRFFLRAGQWFVQPVDQRSLRADKTTNPTLVNQIFVPPGAEQLVRSGDQVTLANIPFNVMLLTS